MSMTGQTVIIAGASRGIGAAAARAFAQAGANVILLARDKASLLDLSDEIGAQALAFQCDVRDFAQVEQAILNGVETFGGCDVLVNNAGMIEPIAGLAEADPKTWARAVEVNLVGVFHGVRAALPLMLASGGGTVLNISSGAAHSAYEGWSAYCAGKAGAAMLTRSLHLEYADRGIRAIGLSPGTVATDMQRVIKASGVGPVAELEWNDHVPPEWPARALVWMCSAEADDLCGGDVRLRDERILKRVGLS